MKIEKHVLGCVLGFVLIVSALAEQDDEAPDSSTDNVSNGRSTAASPGPWFDRILGLIHSKNFRGVYKKYLDNMKQQDSADTTTGELARRDFAPGPVSKVFVKDARSKRHRHHKHHHHQRHHDHKTKVKKWVNVKVVNQVGTRVKIRPDKILPSAVLSSGEIFVYHQLLNETDRKATITLKAVDEYTDKPLILNGDRKFIVTPTTYDDTQEAYVSREDSRSGILHARHGHIVKSLGPGNRWFYVKLLNHAGGQVRVTPDQILPATTLGVDESQVEYARLEPGDEYKRIVLRAVDVKNDEPLKLNGEFTLALRPDDAGDVARVKISRGDTIYAKCDNFVPMAGEDNKFEYQISTDDTKSWFDSVRACKLCNAELLSVHTHDENDFITKQLRKSSDVNKLWIGMSYKEQVRMWSWIDGSRYRYQNWKEGQHYDGKDEQCGIMYQRYDWGRWDDDNCYKPLGYICKRHRTRSSDESKPNKDSSQNKSACPDILPECPSLCRIVKVPGSCPQCDCGPLVKGYDNMSTEEQGKARRVFSEANHQVLAAKRAQIEEAHAMRRSRIMQEAGRLLSESRNLQQIAMMEGIPLNLPFGPVRRREMILKPDKGATEVSKTRNLAHEIASLINDIEKTGNEEKSS
ncbi:uncharacterized protein LOC144646871 isoform X1 [Oculina patagonica]